MLRRGGFTLIELIIVVLVIGILAVTAVPRLLTSSDYAHRATQDQIIAQIRLAQLRALNDRSGCYGMYFFSNTFTIYRAVRASDDSCGSYAATDTSEIDSGVVVDIGGDIASNANVLQILFDNKGRPSGGDCSAGNLCQINITSKQSANVCFESEGYAHDC